MFVFAAATATAAPQSLPQAMHLLLPPCAELPFDAARLTDLLRLELDAIGVERLEVSAALTASDEVPAWVVVTLPNCSPDAEDVALGLLDTHTGRRADTDMHIADLPMGLRSRAIAIRIVELVRTEWPDLAMSPVPAAPPAITRPDVSTSEALVEPKPVAAPLTSSVPVGAPPPSTTPVERVPPAEPRGWSARVEGELAGAAFPSRSTGLIGPMAAIAFVRDHFRISAGGQALFGRATAPVGSADVGWASGYLGAGFVGKSVLLEPRVLLGYAWASGTASDATKVVAHGDGGFAAVLALTGGVRGAIDDNLDVAVDVSAGYAVQGVTFTADDGPIAGVSGAMIAAQIGASLRP